MRKVIVGIDEAGRGPLAGPVVAGACVDCPLFPSFLIKDSKKLTPEERERAFLWIEEHCTYGIGISSAEEIDRIGILEATQKAMQDALAKVATIVTPTYVLIDGRDQFWFDYSHSSIIDGDQKEPCISAASIIAKVTRDRWMVQTAHRQFPQYDFAKHKGYGTPEHLAALEKYGPCPLHRRSFMKNIVQDNPLPIGGRVRERGSKKIPLPPPLSPLPPGGEIVSQPTTKTKLRTGKMALSVPAHA